MFNTTKNTKINLVALTKSGSRVITYYPKNNLSFEIILGIISIISVLGILILR